MLKPGNVGRVQDITSVADHAAHQAIANDGQLFGRNHISYPMIDVVQGEVNPIPSLFEIDKTSLCRRLVS